MNSLVKLEWMKKRNNILASSLTAIQTNLQSNLQWSKLHVKLDRQIEWWGMQTRVLLVECNCIFFLCIFAFWSLHLFALDSRNKSSAKMEREKEVKALNQLWINRFTNWTTHETNWINWFTFLMSILFACFSFTWVIHEWNDKKNVLCCKGDKPF